mgnify:CR=1 FL=1
MEKEEIKRRLKNILNMIEKKDEYTDLIGEVVDVYNGVDESNYFKLKETPLQMTINGLYSPIHYDEHKDEIVGELKELCKNFKDYEFDYDFSNNGVVSIKIIANNW